MKAHPAAPTRVAQHRLCSRSSSLRFPFVFILDFLLVVPNVERHPVVDLSEEQVRALDAYSNEALTFVPSLTSAKPRCDNSALVQKVG